MTNEEQRRELLELVTPEAIRRNLLIRKNLMLSLLSGENMRENHVRDGGDEEMLAILQIRAPFPELSEEEIRAWRELDPRYDALYKEYEARSSSLNGRTP